MAQHPGVYAALLGRKITEHQARCWLINTGWTGGPYGVGHRMKLAHTRAMVNAALSGTLNNVDYVIDPVFGLRVPTYCPDVSSEVLIPKNTWVDPVAYDTQANKLAAMFVKNFESFAAEVGPEIQATGPKPAELSPAGR
jgi:phosphoenolpyruvate carboxykinase (ATP)